MRVVDRRSGASVAYSCDTEFPEAIVALAKDTKVLVHEAIGAFPGHATALEAAQAAKLAGAEKLLVVHLHPEAHPTAEDMEEAQALFDQTAKGLRGGRYEF